MNLAVYWRAEYKLARGFLVPYRRDGYIAMWTAIGMHIQDYLR